MKSRAKLIWANLPVVLLIGSAILLGVVGCAANTRLAAKPGAQLWGENCGRCHNIRTPSGYSDEQWDVAVSHMRTRANLTATEEEKIVEFLKASN